MSSMLSVYIHIKGSAFSGFSRCLGTPLKAALASLDSRLTGQAGSGLYR